MKLLAASVYAHRPLKSLLLSAVVVLCSFLFAGLPVSAQTGQSSGGLEREAEPGLPASCTAATYLQEGDVVTQKNKTYVSTHSDVIESVICVKDGGWLTLISPKISKTREGNEDGEFGGQGVEASEASVVNIIDGEIFTDTEGGNGLWATNEGSLIYMRGGSITTTQGAGHGVDTTKRASIILDDVTIDTAGGIGAGALVNDSGDGTVYATRVKARTQGFGSPGFYMIGDLSFVTIKDSTIVAETSDAGVLVYGADAAVENSHLTGAKGIKVAGGSYTMTGGSLTATGGDAFYITTGEDGPGGGGAMPEGAGGAMGMPGGGAPGGMPEGGMPESGMPEGGMPANAMGGEMPEGGMPGGSAPGGMPGGGGGSAFPGGSPGLGGDASIPSTIAVKGGTKISASTGNIVMVPADNEATFTAQETDLVGDMSVAETGALSVTLTDSSLTGTVSRTALTLTGSSSWHVTGNSSLTSLSNTGGISGERITNIYGNGHTVTYDPALEGNKALGGKTYALQGGGTLVPEE